FRQQPGRSEGFGIAPVEGADILGFKGVTQRAHDYGMTDTAKGLKRRGAHSLRGRAWGDEVRMRVFQSHQLFHEPVVFGIGNKRRVLYIIAMVVLFYFAPQDLNTLCDRTGVIPLHENNLAVRNSPATKPASCSCW